MFKAMRYKYPRYRVKRRCDRNGDNYYSAWKKFGWFWPWNWFWCGLWIDLADDEIVTTNDRIIGFHVHEFKTFDQAEDVIKKDITQCRVIEEVEYWEIGTDK